MESKHKNALIGALLAVVFVMAVGYAAFAQTLTISGTASIDSTWNVHFDASKTEGAEVINAEAGLVGATAPDGGTISYDDSDHKANLSATLHQPGDKVTYTLTILNTGSIDAALHEPVLTVEGATAGSGLTQSKGNIQFTVQGLAEGTSLPKTSGSTTVKVIAEYIDSAGGDTTSGTAQSATATITIDAYQATA